MIIKKVNFIVILILIYIIGSVQDSKKSNPNTKSKDNLKYVTPNYAEIHRLNALAGLNVSIFSNCFSKVALMSGNTHKTCFE